MISIVTQPSVVVFSKGDVIVKLFAGEAVGIPWTLETKPINYSVEFEVLMELEYGEGTYTSVFLTDEYPNTNGDITINISSIIHSGIISSYTEPPLPAINSISAFRTDNLRKYKVRAREISGNNFDPGAWLDIGTNLKVIFGGISVDRSIDAWDASQLDQEQSVFSWMPNGMMVGLDQPLYVTIMGGGSVLATIYNTEGEELTSVLINDPGVSDGECATYFIGPKIFDPGDVASGVKVVIQFQAVGLVRYYYLDHYRQGKMDVVFINGFGAAECIRMYGEIDESLKVTRLKSQSIRKSDTELSVGDMVQYGGTWDDQFTLRTGYISEGEARAMKDMLAYNFLFWIRGSVYEALDIVTDDVLINSTGQFLKALEFNAVRSVKKKIMPTL